MRDLVRRCLVPTLGTSEYEVSDLRRISLRLAGLRCVVSDHLARQVATEFIIHSLVVESDEEEMFALLAEKRTEVRVRLRGKYS